MSKNMSSKPSKQLLIISALSCGLLACQAVPFQSTTLPNPAPQVSTLNASSQASGALRLAADAQILKAPMTPEKVYRDHLVFRQDPQLQTGQVVLGRSQAGEDFVRRVRLIRNNSGVFQVYTTPASLYEAFDELDIGGARFVQPRGEQRLDLDRIRFNIGLMEVEGKLSVKADFSDSRLQIKNKELFVRVAPTFEFETTLTPTFRLPVESFSDNNPLRPVGEFNFKGLSIPAWIGPVPVVFNLTPSAALSWGSQGSGSFAFDTQFGGNIKAGVEMNASFEEAPRMSSFSQQDLNGSLKNPRFELSGKAHARVFIPRIQLDTQIAGLVGPYIQVGPFIDGQAERRMTQAPQGKLRYTRLSSDLGLNIKGGLTDTSLFGKKFANGIHKTILDRKLKQIYFKETTDAAQ